MSTNRALWIGGIGTLVAAICCFTPALVVLLGALGLSALVGYLDLVLLPLLGIFVLILIFGVVQMVRA
ncbi:mercury resistance system transport protein MerF [Yoonia sp. SDW83-1]|uniref:mercury resistance system transport protein MerF n=1 Tax=Yoonia sp. SDW83-1 TaxID=3366945 RepID=UPI00398C5D32